MKCHYIYDEEAGKVLIPYCWAVVISGDMKDCTCRSKVSRNFEKQQYNEILAEKNREISDLEKDNARLNRIIKRLLNK